MADVTFPLDPASVENGKITLDLFVNQPARISNYVSQLVQRDLVSQYLFSSTAAQGGAILYDRLERNEAYANQKPGVIAPGGEFPNMGTDQGEPEVRRVVKTGGRFEVTREAAKRNDASLVQRNGRRIANTMVKDIDERAFQSIYSDLEDASESLEFASDGWASALQVTAGEKTATTAEGAITADLLRAKLMVENTDLGYSPDTLVMTPTVRTNLQILLGVNNWTAVLQSIGLTPYTTTALPVEGEALLLERNTVGVMGVEDPISTDNEYIKARQVTAFYTWATMAFGVTDPLSIVRLTGLDQ